MLPLAILLRISPRFSSGLSKGILDVLSQKRGS